MGQPKAMMVSLVLLCLPDIEATTRGAANSFPFHKLGYSLSFTFELEAEHEGC